MLWDWVLSSHHKSVQGTGSEQKEPVLLAEQGVGVCEGLLWWGGVVVFPESLDFAGPSYPWY